MSTAMSVDEGRLQAFMGKMVDDMSAAMSGALVLIGDKLGLYKALAGHGPLTPRQLADRTGTSERYVREWLAAQAASDYVTYDAKSGHFSMSAEQAMALAQEDSPVFLAGAFDIIAAAYMDEPKVRQAFRTGGGVGWHEHSQCLFQGTERFFRTSYTAHLVQEWLPALDGAVAKLEKGARVADVGCGHGASTILMARAFPHARFFGFDYHDGSITRARKAAEASGLGNLHFEVASAKAFRGSDFDLITAFDCLHDMGDPVGAARRIREALAPDGIFMLVEPFARDRLADNLNPVGRMYYSASTMICTPASLSQEVGLALGAQAGEARLRGVLEEAGFTRIRRAAETPFNLILEARP
ncbi:class I SAM-dependent methyltransferase [Roseomonas sp. E05]|uniref:class I SAM-dependent methyltransferase n=1 Tax=Roseomonas sp. E05 TaxID=3046310 RepID=UPI0024BB7582|nr:class I SAM-dependent methyltransferase [Roseomonas sp. E05]MDJ0387546.1 class I SAM-dependent methyltransferase [Roseomonas sp. E05]